MKRQKGMALLIVMMTISALAVIVYNTSNLWRLHVNEIINLQAESQITQDLLGAEKYLLRQLSAGSLVSGQTGVIEQGTTRVRWRTKDVQACFNLNSLATQTKTLEDGSYYLPESHRIFQSLLSQQGMNNEISIVLTKTLSEIIKPDAGKKTSKRFVTLGQMTTLPGVDPVMMKTLTPFVCLLPSDRIQVSINGLMPQEALLLSALTEGKLSAEDAMHLIRNRPARGWQHFEQITQLLPDASREGLSGLQPFLTFESHHWQLILETDETAWVALHSQLAEKNGNYVVQQRHWKKFGV